MFLMHISSSRFKRSNISLLIPHKLFGEFWVYLGIYSKRIGKIYRNWTFERFYVVFRSEFEVKKLVDVRSVHQTVVRQPGVPFWGQSTVWWSSETFFFTFNASLNVLSFRLKLRWTHEANNSILFSKQSYRRNIICTLLFFHWFFPISEFLYVYLFDIVFLCSY